MVVVDSEFGYEHADAGFAVFGGSLAMFVLFGSTVLEVLGAACVGVSGDDVGGLCADVDEFGLVFVLCGVEVDLEAGSHTDWLGGAWRVGEVTGDGRGLRGGKNM